jgi:hypothetical protein
MKTLIRSINRSPLRCGFFTLAIALAWFALSPPLKAVDCPSDCDNSLGQTALGFTALAVNTGFNNTGVGQGALQQNTTGSFNVAIGGGALLSNTTGQQNMAVGAEALNHNIAGNFNMGIGFRALFLNTGGQNTAVGAAALRNNGNASQNTAIGSQALRENTTGEPNTAVGSLALTLNTTSEFNVAMGDSALGAFNGTTAADGANTALGSIALTALTSGQENVAVGRRGLENLLSGSNNTAVGWRAGDNYTGGESGNISIGSQVTGVAGENNTTRIGNIASTPFTTGGFFLYEVNGAIGVFTSSRKFKDDIKPIDKASETIYSLNPVTFRAKAEADPTRPRGFGLIAEEVEKVNPDLVSHGQKDILTVRYESINAMLLNEFLKEHKKVEEQQASIGDLKLTVASQQKEMQVLTAQLKEQAAQIQKVSARLEASKAAPKVVANK